MKAYFSCGAGDFVAIESFMTDREKKQISGIILVTRAAEHIKQLLQLHPVWRGVPVEVPLTPQQIREYGVYAFYSIKHLRRITQRAWKGFDYVVDFSGERLYPEILNGERKYNGVGFKVETTSCDVVFDIESLADDRMTRKGRNLTIEEIQNLEKRCDGKQIIVAGEGRTLLRDALGYVAGCSEFYGIDSLLACWAARQPVKQIIVKSINPIYRKWLPIYDPFKKIKIVESFV